MHNAKCKTQNAKCKMQNAKTQDAKRKSAPKMSMTVTVVENY
jgi:hypothetical protein